MPKTTVLFDVVQWTSDPPAPGQKRESHLARKGEEIDIPRDELDRLEALGAVGSAAEGVSALAAGAEAASWDDTQLDSSNVDDIVVYLGQHSSEADRVLEAERTREVRNVGKVRATVIKAAERVKAARDQEIEDRLEAEEAARDAEQRAYENTTGASSGAPAIPQPGA